MTNPMKFSRLAHVVVYTRDKVCSNSLVSTVVVFVPGVVIGTKGVAAFLWMFPNRPLSHFLLGFSHCYGYSSTPSVARPPAASRIETAVLIALAVVIKGYKYDSPLPYGSFSLQSAALTLLRWLNGERGKARIRTPSRMDDLFTLTLTILPDSLRVRFLPRQVIYQRPCWPAVDV